MGIVVDADSASSRLVFREVNNSAGNGLFIDNVRLVKINEATTPQNDFVIDIDPSSSGNNGTASFEENGDPASVFPNGVDIQHASNNTLDFAVVRITNLLDGASEVLAADVGSTGLTTSYDAANGRLTISGVASLADYESVLATVTYDNSSASPDDTTRSISLSVTDRGITSGDNFSSRSFVDLSIVPFNSSPDIETIADTTANFGAAFTQQVNATDAESTNLTYSVSATGDTGTTTPTISDSGLISWTPIVTDGGTADITVTVTDEEGVSSEETFSVAVNGFVPFEGDRALTNIDPALRNGIYDEAPVNDLDTSLDYVAVLNTDVGEIRLNLFDDQAPLTVNNFVKLAEDGFYDGVTFHRVITGFVAQGGDPLGTGTGGPGYSFADEIVDGLTFNGRGQLAMANSGPATNGSQFFITYAAQPHLTGVHTIFGELVSGDAAFDAITVTGGSATPTVINSVEIIRS